MQLMGMGLDFETGERLFSPVDEREFVNELLGVLGPKADSLKSAGDFTARGATFRGEVERAHTVDLGDARAAGWTYLVAKDDPQRDAIEAALAPLAEHRGMTLDPLVFDEPDPDEWATWIEDNYHMLELDGTPPPHYILIAAGPDQVPFKFQSMLDIVGSVGRVAFDTTADLQTYVAKLIRLETAGDPAPSRETVFFATDHGSRDPTFFSREYMVLPLENHVRTERGFATHLLEGEDATKANLLQTLQDTNPCLVYTASHGLIATGQPQEEQMKVNGAIACHRARGMRMQDTRLTAEDIPMNVPFLEGSVFFQFACFGYGTPAESDYTHWTDNQAQTLTDSDLVAALPKRLLAHPEGPVAFVGHLDTAFLHAFTDAADPHIADLWHPRIRPFLSAVNTLLDVQPGGLAMAAMNERFNIGNARITNALDRHQRGRMDWEQLRLRERFIDAWITRSDAQNYMIYGDPAARVRIPSA